MKLIVKPSDLIKRFIWDKYQHFCLQYVQFAEINKIIEEDKEFEISEAHAFVIGLTNVIYTDKVVHKLKMYLKELLENKSFDEMITSTEVSQESGEDETYQTVKLLVNKQIIIDGANDFLNKIPKNWDPSGETNIFYSELKNIPALTKAFIAAINSLPVTIVQDWPCVKYISVKKTINKIIK